MAEVADVGTAIALGVKAEQSELDKTMLQPSVNLVRMYFSRLSHRGGDVVWLTDRGPGKSIVPQGLDAREWRWRDVISTKWQFKGGHINVLTMRWRFRDIQHVGTKFLHLVDSKVTLGVVAKGRTSSMRRVVAKANALLLAGFSTMALGFVRAHLNPADRPSRREGKTTNAAADDGQQTE